MTHEKLIAELAQLEAYFANRVRIVRVIIGADGKPTGQRICTGSFQAPLDWQPPTFERLMSSAKKETTHD